MPLNVADTRRNITFNTIHIIADKSATITTIAAYIDERRHFSEFLFDRRKV